MLDIGVIPRPQLDPQSEVPLYHQLCRHFTELIRSGSLKQGERLPPTRELAGLLGLNRTTVSAAYELLESDGLITGHVGRGSFVTGGETVPAAGLNWDAILDASHATSAPESLQAGPDTISFAVSRPSEELFPMDDFRASCEEVMAGPDFASVLQLGSPGGYEPLRQYLIEEHASEGVLRPGDDLMITSGCQQALDLVRRVLVRAGRQGPGRGSGLSGFEEPVSRGRRGADRHSSACQTEWTSRSSNARLRKRESKAAGGDAQFSESDRRHLAAQAAKPFCAWSATRGAVLIENDIYGELRYEGETLPTLKQMDETGDVILLRSFSKIAFPGLRVGWAIGPRAVIARMMEAKQLSDLHTDQFSQAVLLRFAEVGPSGSASRAHACEPAPNA